MFLTSGEVFYADLAERIAMNAMPGAFMNGSMWCKSELLPLATATVTLSRNDYTLIAALPTEAEPS